MAGYYEEIIQTTNNIVITHRIYAHQFYTRLLITDVTVDRSNCNSSSACCNLSADFIVSRTDLNLNPEEADFDWNTPSNYTDHAYCVSTGCR
jgi:hypothetical protein